MSFGIGDSRVRYDPVTDIEGASEADIDTVLVDRRENVDAPRATYVLPDLNGLPGIVEG